MQTIQAHLTRNIRLALAGTLLVAAALLLLAATAGSQASASDASASGSSTVTIKNFKFGPGTLRVAPGTRVVFSNAESGKTKHTATRKGSFDTGKIKPGQAVAIRFTAPGTYAYHCTIHPEMHGKIIVG